MASKITIAVEFFISGLLSGMLLGDITSNSKVPKSEKQKYSYELSKIEDELESRIKNADRMLDTTTIAQPEHYRADALYDMAKEDIHRIERVEFWMPRKMVEETKSTNKERIIQVKRNLDSLESILYRKMKNNVVKSECKQPPMKHLAPLKR